LEGKITGAQSCSYGKECEGMVEYFFLWSVLIFTTLQIVHTRTTSFAEVQFYFRLSINEKSLALALVSLYSSPHQDLLRLSRRTLWSYTFGGDALLKVVDVKTISAVVAMVPHTPFLGDRERFFLVEKPGLDIAVLGGVDEHMDID
jgi:hypothetical protein